jgi:uncharacterized protein DUF3631
VTCRHGQNIAASASGLGVLVQHGRQSQPSSKLKFIRAGVGRKRAKTRSQKARSHNGHARIVAYWESADCWEPLLAVADAAGGHWPDIARVAAVALVASARDANPSMGILLLEHCRTVFGDADRLPSEQLLLRLHDLPESPWGNVKGKPLDDRGLAYRLRKYEIKPKVIRFGLTTARGYLRADFEDVWPRYLPPPSPQEAQHA